ncbi:MAG: transporter [Gammaproteobacteria bacterium]
MVVAVAIGLLATTSDIHAQSLEPRAYSNSPVGLNFLVVGFQNPKGALLFDPALPVEDINADIDMAMLGYVRTLDVAGNSAKVGVLLPYATFSGEGFVDGNLDTRDTGGFADPAFYFSLNFHGAPALSLKEFNHYQQDTIVGFSFKLTAPLGTYDPDKIFNIGTNRWSFEPRIGVSQALGNWILEGSAAITFYTDNNNFFNGGTRQQENVYSTQFHAIYSFPRNIWLALSATYYTGGETTINGVIRNDLQQNWRTGFTLALPVNRRHSIKLFGSRGISTRTGNNYDTAGIAWQYRWGGGI